MARRDEQVPISTVQRSGGGLLSSPTWGPNTDQLAADGEDGWEMTGSIPHRAEKPSKIAGRAILERER